MAYLFDTSAWMEYFKDDEGAELVQTLLLEEIFSPGIVLAETASVLRKYDFSEEEISLAINFITVSGVIIPIERGLANDASKIKKEKQKKHKNISLADCIVIATARRVGGTLVSTDPHVTDEHNAINPRKQ